MMVQFVEKDAITVLAADMQLAKHISHANAVAVVRILYLDIVRLLAPASLHSTP